MRWLQLALTAAAAARVVFATIDRPRLARRNDEHVALCDCKDSGGVISSQIAYFPGSPNVNPQDVAVVATPQGQARIWSGAKTSALFSTTQVTFTATLGPQVQVGEIAGTGDNGYPDPFTCWYRPKQDLYQYDGRTCSMVYDCSHEPANSTSTSTGTGSATATVISTSTTTSTQTSTASQGQGADVLSRGAMIGVIVGVTLVVLFLVGVAFACVCVQRRRAHAEEEKEQHGRLGSPCSTIRGGVFDAEGTWHQTVNPYVSQELDGQYRGVEIHAGPTGGYREIDSKQIEIPSDAATNADNRPNNMAPTS